MLDPTCLLAPTVSKGPSGESPARISAVNPGVSLVTTIRSGAPSASTTSPTPDLNALSCERYVACPVGRRVAVGREAGLVVVLAVAAVGS